MSTRRSHFVKKEKRPRRFVFFPDAAPAIIRDWTTLSARLFACPFVRSLSSSSADFLSCRAETRKLSTRVDRNRTPAAHRSCFGVYSSHRSSVSRHPLPSFYFFNYSTTHIRVIKDLHWRYNESMNRIFRGNLLNV